MTKEEKEALLKKTTNKIVREFYKCDREDPYPRNCGERKFRAIIRGMCEKWSKKALQRRNYELLNFDYDWICHKVFEEADKYFYGDD